MDSGATPTTPTDADEAAVRSIHHRMIDAWNVGDAKAFVAPFTDDADFVAFEGTHLKGREAMVRFNQQAFDTVVKGSRMTGEVEFVRFLAPDRAVIHSTVAYALAGEEAPPPSRDSMQLTVVGKHGGEWRAEALMNARKISLERQGFLDALDDLSEGDRKRVEDLVASAKDQKR